MLKKEPGNPSDAVEKPIPSCSQCFGPLCGRILMLRQLPLWRGRRRDGHTRTGRTVISDSTHDTRPPAGVGTEVVRGDALRPGAVIGRSGLEHPRLLAELHHGRCRLRYGCLVIVPPAERVAVPVFTYRRRQFCYRSFYLMPRPDLLLMFLVRRGR